MKPSSDEIRQSLAKVLASPDFASAGRLGPFLSHVVTTTLAGETDRLKESVLGVEFFGRGTGYDPRLDPVVRIEARRLRLRLEKYYATAGESDPIRIDLPKGGYVPAFAYAPTSPRPWFRRSSFLLAATSVAVFIAILFVVWSWLSPQPAVPADPARVAFERGVYQMNLFSEVGMERAIGYFNESLGHNPRYAPSLAYLSQVYAILTYYNSLPNGIPADKARALAESAIQADPGLAEGHAAMGFCLAGQQYRWKDAEEEFRTALRLNPQSGLTHGLYALSVLAPQVRPETLPEFKRALELEPNSRSSTSVYAFPDGTGTWMAHQASTSGPWNLKTSPRHALGFMAWRWDSPGDSRKPGRAFTGTGDAGQPEEPLGGLEALHGRPAEVQAGPEGHGGSCPGRARGQIGPRQAGGDGGRNRDGFPLARARHRNPRNTGDLAQN